jgi:UDP-N-acetylmuramate dehydrogenase
MTSHSAPSITVQQNVRLSAFTTIGLGGNARYFVSCQTLDQVCEALGFAHDRNLRVHVLGGGSNVVFADNGFEGLVIRIELKEVSFSAKDEAVLVTAAGGEEWDTFVQQCIAADLAGIECLAGIPGFVGATPIQNVGAYGQEVCQTIVSVKAIDRQSHKIIEFTNADCRFGYRQSRFKSTDADKYIVVGVTFRLTKYGRPEIRYPELQQFIASSVRMQSLPDGEPVLSAVRNAVLALRRRKSMVVDPNDPNTRSVGSFFTNPIVSMDQFEAMRARWDSSGGVPQIPTFPSGSDVKVPAAWLVEQAGFRKGYRSGGIGISQNHSLALVNFGGSTRELLDLAARIQDEVSKRFGIVLEKEPVVVQARP